MMRCDAEWLAGVLATLPDADISPVLNLGSSTRHFREVAQPYIADLVFSPLARRGIEVVHSDLKAADGVDIAGDIFDDDVLARIKAVGPKSVICTHMLEHVRDRDALVRRIMEVLPANGLFFVTVPSSYHEHHDPIDTMYRPSPCELRTLFAGHDVFCQAELTGATYWAAIRKRPATLIWRHVSRFFVPFLGLRKWRRSMAKLYWLAHPYKVAAIAGRKSL